ncbi:MAG: hypothetical protein V7L05_28920 [Nostoc sp.]|uniref:hypothetical protein n=1 Tax=Nostoc sp. TaxID=1180 RepID=UPI002FFC43F6
MSLTLNSCLSNSQKSSQSATNPPKAVENTAAVVSTPTPDDKAIPKYDHIFVIVEENKSYDQIIGNPNAPIINQLAKTYGLASNFYGEVHPSEANYVAILSGSTFGIHDDDAFYNFKYDLTENVVLKNHLSHRVVNKTRPLMSMLFPNPSAF